MPDQMTRQKYAVPEIASRARSTVGLRGALLGSIIALSLLVPEIATAEDYRPGSGDEFIVVDCLLPGQVRRLGNRVYQSRRRPVMATAKECHIRGGEYVLDDRASLSGSLQAWLPLAMDGDVEAQNYVGELAERGPNGQPDYAMARLWYGRAAEQGSNTARFNLARLYEDGLGGDADPEKAAALYKAAHGFDGELATLVSMVDTGQITALQSELDERNAALVARDAEIERLRVRIDVLDRDQAALEAERNAALNEAAALRTTIAEQRSALATALAETAQASVRSANADAFSDLEAARNDLALKQAALEQRAGTLAARERALGAELEALETVSEANASEVTRLTGELVAARAQLAALEADAAGATRQRDAALDQLAGTRQDLDARIAAVAEREAALAALERSARETATTEQAVRQAELDAGRAALAQEREAFRADFAAYEAKRSELEARIAAVATKEAAVASKAASVQANLAALNARAAEIEGLATQQAALAAERDAFEAERAEARTAQAEYAARLDALAQREQRFARQVEELERRATAVSLQEAEIDKRERDALEARTSAETALAQLEALKQQIQLAQDTLAGEGGQRSLVPGVQPLTPKPIRDTFEIEFGTYHALLIGNENYSDPDWPDLDTSHNDVSAIGELLKTKYGFETKVLKDATRFDILKALSDLGDELGPEDNLLIYFAGHGQYIDQVSSGYWEPVDSIPYKTVNSISVQDVNTQLSLTKARKVLVVSDSCYSGAFTRAPFAVLDTQAGHDAREKYLQQIAGKRSRNVMTAGGLQPVADGLGNGHSLFARAFISALVDNDDVALGRDVFSRVRDVVTVSATAMNWEQEPEYDEIVHSGHEGGDFIFVPVAP
ncbi:MAG: caspase family protein [Pseudomonadota bacterium]